MESYKTNITNITNITPCNICNIDLFNQIIKNNNKKFIVIDGIIGAGKTTFINLLIENYKKKGKKSHPIYEPVDIWKSTGALEYFYEDIPKNAYEFQTFTFITRIKRIIDEVVKNPDADYYILERTIFTDKYIFVELLKKELGPVKMNMYNMWWDMWTMLLKNIVFDKWVLLDTSIDTSLDRIKKRNRSGELVDETYQRNLHKAHIDFYEKIKKEYGDNVKIIPSSLMDKNFIEDNSIINEISELI